MKPYYIYAMKLSPLGSTYRNGLFKQYEYRL